mmetsp:Transcript_57808/g.165804  ORF Transcript_57808/g.165804 Transcript_57808/m.165804 type:complete len:84 (+) Transcript_57808:3-254(+)
MVAVGIVCYTCGNQFQSDARGGHVSEHQWSTSIAGIAVIFSPSPGNRYRKLLLVGIPTGLLARGQCEVDVLACMFVVLVAVSV